MCGGCVGLTCASQEGLRAGIRAGAHRGDGTRPSWAVGQEAAGGR